MKFKIDDVIDEMLSSGKGVIKTEWKQVKGAAETFLQSKKKRLAMIADYRIKNEITDEELESFMEDEKTLFTSEMAALKVITKAAAQKVANAAINVLHQAIKKLLPVP